MNLLFIIPARGGSKGLPGKNIRPLNGKPLILYSLQFARLFTTDEHICVSTDDPHITSVVKDANYTPLFSRPKELASDESGMREVLLHALEKYEKKNGSYDAIVLLQPTSPFRKKTFLDEALRLFNKDTDMVVSVNESKANPYFNLFEENSKGHLELSKRSPAITRRQDAPAVYQYNGSIYIINPRSLRSYDSLSQFPVVLKYVMNDEYGVDIDNLMDWARAEYILNNHLVEVDGKR